MKLALVVGHQKSSQGAVNTDGTTEFAFNDDLAISIKDFWDDRYLEKTGDTIEIMYRETNYSNLPGEINARKPDFVVELHCNAFNTEANGCETLYYHTSTKGKEISRYFQSYILKSLGNKDRGIKPKTASDRGGYILRYTNAPCIITEPFFIDNKEELNNARKRYFDGRLVEAFCEAIKDSFVYLKLGDRVA